MKKYLIFIFLFTLSVFAQKEIVLSTTHNSEIWEGDQIPAKLSLPRSIGELSDLEFTDGIYIVNSNELSEGQYDLKVIVTDREKFFDLSLKDLTQKLFKVKVQGFNFKKDKIKRGSFVLPQELNKHIKIIFYVIALLILIICLLYYLKAKKKKELLKEIENKKNHLISIIRSVENKKSFNDFFHQKEEMSNFFIDHKIEITKYIKSCEDIVYKDEITEKDQEALKSKSSELATILEANSGL